MSIHQVTKRAFQSLITATDRVTRSKPSLKPEDLRKHRNFLIFMHPSALGTAIHGTPLPSAIKQRIPDASVAVVTSGFSAECFRNHPHVDHFLETVSPLKDRATAIRQLKEAKLFRGEPFVAITPKGSERTPIAMAVRSSGAAVRVGFTTVPQWFDIPLDFDSEISLIDNNLRIIAALGHDPIQGVPPIIVPSKEDRERAERLLPQDQIQGRQLAVLVTQTSVTQRKSWRADRFKAVAEHLVNKHNVFLVFPGTAGEHEAIETLREYIGLPSINIAGKTGIADLTAVFQQCRIAISLDTGPLHIARAAGLPAVVIAPAWSPVIEWLPVEDPKYRILKNATIPAPPPEDYIIDEVSVGDVIAAADSLLVSVG